MPPFLITINVLHLFAIVGALVFVLTSKPDNLSKIAFFLLLVFLNLFFLIARILYKRAERQNNKSSARRETDTQDANTKEDHEKLRALFRASAKRSLRISALMTLALAIKIIVENAL